MTLKRRCLDVTTSNSVKRRRPNVHVPVINTYCAAGVTSSPQSDILKKYINVLKLYVWHLLKKIHDITESTQWAKTPKEQSEGVRFC